MDNHPPGRRRTGPPISLTTAANPPNNHSRNLATRRNRDILPRALYPLGTLSLCRVCHRPCEAVCVRGSLVNTRYENSVGLERRDIKVVTQRTV